MSQFWICFRKEIEGGRREREQEREREGERERRREAGSCFLNQQGKLLEALTKELGHEPSILRKMYDYL